MTGSICCRVGQHAITQRLGNDMVILNAATEQFIGLNAVGACIWEAIAAGAGSPVQAVLDAFAGVTPEEAERDVDAFVGELRRLGLLTCDNGGHR